MTRRAASEYHRERLLGRSISGALAPSEAAERPPGLPRPRGGSAS